MTEGKVNWHFTCPRCEKGFNYGMFAGVPIKLCGACQKVIYNKAIKDSVDSTIDEGTSYFIVEGKQYSAGWDIINGIDEHTIEMEELK